MKKIKNDVLPHGKNKLSLIQLLESFYHVRTTKDLLKSLRDDVVATFFLNSGTGIILSFIKGVYFSLFLKLKPPVMIGKRFKIINYSNINIGKNLWVKDDVTMLAGGKLNIGNGCVFCDRSSIWSGKEGLTMGDACSLGINGYICGSEGKITIGNSVIMADNTRLYSWNHKMSTKGKEFSNIATTHKGIVIGNNCWLGSGCVILDGVTLGNNCVVGAGTIVTKSFPKNSLIVGVPARLVKRL